MDDDLSLLNESQRKSASWNECRCLLILAGPGSGKTRTLTARVEHLLKHGGIKPWELMVLTFTNKAANELRERISKRIGAEVASKAMIGTFHSVCYRLLRVHGQCLGLSPNFTVLDSNSKKSKIRKIAQELTIDTRLNNCDALVSKYKMNRWTRQQLASHVSSHKYPAGAEAILLLISKYESFLADSHLLDFDDLLNLGLDLVSKVGPQVVGNIRHILIDEFQDTNTSQFEFMEAISRCRDPSDGLVSISVVGDPDQCIYSWRSADATNIKRLQALFDGAIKTIYLEQNYRSSVSILECSMAVIKQDTARIDRKLWTSNPNPSPVILKVLSDDIGESRFVASEIMRLVKESNGRLDLGDFAILVRTHAHSTQIEGALRENSIAYNMLGGMQFFERAEVKDLISYLRFVYNDRDEVAFARVINVPRRGVGEVTLSSIVAEQASLKTGFLSVVEDLISGKRKLKAGRLPKLAMKQFLDVVYGCRQLMEQDKGVLGMAEYLITSLNYEGYLEKTFAGNSERRKELLSNLCQYLANIDVSCKEEDGAAPYTSVALARLLESVVLDPGLTQNGTAELAKKVAVSTIHAAKGLEWPVVFVIGAEEGNIPHFRCKSESETQEERRLLYVAMTRAKALLYLTCAEQRGHRSYDVAQPSSFLKPLCEMNLSLVSPNPLVKDLKMWSTVITLLQRRPLTSEERVSYATDPSPSKDASKVCDKNFKSSDPFYRFKEVPCRSSQKRPLQGYGDSNSTFLGTKSKRPGDFESRNFSSMGFQPSSLLIKSKDKIGGDFAIGKLSKPSVRSVGRYRTDTGQRLTPSALAARSSTVNIKSSATGQPVAELKSKTTEPVRVETFEPLAISEAELGLAVRGSLGTKVTQADIRDIFQRLKNGQAQKTDGAVDKSRKARDLKRLPIFFND